MRRLRIGALAAAAAALMVAATACAETDPAATGPAATDRATADPGAPADEATAGDDQVALLSGRNRRGTHSVRDWVTYADHILVVTVVGETRLTPSSKEIERGEGMIGRTVKLRVDRVLWSAPDAPHPAPAVVGLSAAGWVFNDNEDGAGTVKFAMEGSSRLDQGHTYVKALEWVDDPCSADPEQGEWTGLGAGDAIPFDGGTLGVGEFEGRVQKLDEAKAALRSVEPALRDVRQQMVGEPVDRLVARLRATSPGAEQGNEPRECDPSDR